MLARAERLLPDGHGQITVRGDSGFYAVELMTSCRKRAMRFTFSATRTTAMWAKLAEIPDGGWEDALQMHGAEVAEVPLIPEGCKHEQLRLIVRRVPVTAAELQAGSPEARRRKTIPPEQLQKAPPATPPTSTPRSAGTPRPCGGSCSASPAGSCAPAAGSSCWLPEGFPHYETFNTTYHAALALALALPGP